MLIITLIVILVEEINTYNYDCISCVHAGAVVQNQLRKPQMTVYERLANIIMNGNNSGGVEAVAKAFDVYRSCMDGATIERLGATPLLNLIRDSLGALHKCNFN